MSLVARVSQQKGVRAALLAVAKQKAAEAAAITAAAGGDAKFTVDEGIRPKGRARVNIVSDSPEEEFGTSTTPKIAALRRIAYGK